MRCVPRSVFGVRTLRPTTRGRLFVGLGIPRLDISDLNLLHFLMEPPRRKRLPHDVPPWVAEGSFFFITINCQPRGRNHLCRAGIGDVVLAAAAHYHTHFKWHCRLMLLMPDHLHAIIAVPATPGLRITVRFWKRFLSRVHRVKWQGDFFDHRLRDHHQQLAKTDYILKNPFRWGLCERVEEWPWVYRPGDRLPPRVGD